MAITDSIIRYPNFKQKRHKFYFINEVDEHLSLVARETEKERKELTELSSRYEALCQEDRERKSRLATAEDQLSRQTKELEERTQEIIQLRSELLKIHVENTRLHEELALLGVESSKMQTRIEKMNELIARLESKSTEEMILNAENRASDILARAVTDSEKMLQQVNEQRANVVAASRAAYYNALQFKQELAERFHRMEQELDTSIDILRILENSRLTLSQLTDSSRIVNEHDSMVS